MLFLFGCFFYIGRNDAYPYPMNRLGANADAIFGEWRAKMIRDIRHAAQKELAAIYGKPHKLELWGKVELNWSRNYWMLKKFGYVGA